MRGFGMSILRLAISGWGAAGRSLFQLCDSFLRTFDPARLRPLIKFACLGGIAGDSACAPRLQHAGIVSLGQHKGSSCAAMLKSVFKQGSSAADVGLLEQGVCSGKQPQFVHGGAGSDPGRRGSLRHRCDFWIQLPHGFASG
jgi:hypothetical protein